MRTWLPATSAPWKLWLFSISSMILLTDPIRTTCNDLSHVLLSQPNPHVPSLCILVTRQSSLVSSFGFGPIVIVYQRPQPDHMYNSFTQFVVNSNPIHMCYLFGFVVPEHLHGRIVLFINDTRIACSSKIQQVLKLRLPRDDKWGAAFAMLTFASVDLRRVIKTST